MPDTIIAPLGAQECLYRGPVPAGDPWFKPSVQLHAGERYFFRASGQWFDWYTPHSASGEDSPSLAFAHPMLRCKSEGATWFTLIGSIEKDTDSFFVIGDGLRWPTGWVAPASGQLYCFANDVRIMYFNNSQAIQLEVWQ